MASIRKTKNGKWQATISAGRDADGKQLRKYVTADTEKECKRLAREIEQDIDEGKLINLKNIRLSKWCDEWLEMNKNRLSPSTYLSYKMYIEIHYKPYFKKLKLSQINEIHIKKYINAKLETHSSTTVKKHFLVLRKILREGLKNKSPAEYIDPPKIEKYKSHIVTDEELKLILDKFKGSHYEIIILLSAYCGLRRGEICALKWDDVDWNEGTIKIDEAVTLSENGYIDKKPKSDNGLRTIHAPKTLMDLLQEYRKSNLDTKRIINITPGTITGHFVKMMDKLGLNVRFHDLRHYHASWLYKNQIPDIHAAQRLGHDINTLKRIYQHLDVSAHKEIEENIVNLINNK